MRQTKNFIKFSYRAFCMHVDFCDFHGVFVGKVDFVVLKSPLWTKLQTQMSSLRVTGSINIWIKCCELLLCWLSLAKQLANESIYSSVHCVTISNESINSPGSLGWSQMNLFIHMIHWDNLKWTDSFTCSTGTISNESIPSLDSMWHSQMNRLLHLIRCDNLKWINSFMRSIGTLSIESIHSSDSPGQSQINRFIQVVHWDNLNWIDLLIWFIASIIISTLQ